MSSPANTGESVLTRSGAPSTIAGLAIFLLAMTAASLLVAALQIAGTAPAWFSSVVLGLTLTAIFAPSAVRSGNKWWNRSVSRNWALVNCVAYGVASAVAFVLVATLGNTGAFWAIGIGAAQVAYGATLVVRAAMAK